MEEMIVKLVENSLLFGVLFMWIIFERKERRYERERVAFYAERMIELTTQSIIESRLKRLIAEYVAQEKDEKIMNLRDKTG